MNHGPGAEEETRFEERVRHDVEDRRGERADTRREKGLTQQALADRIGIHGSQLRRYEAGTNQPTLDVLRATAVALSVSIDALVFGDDERGPRTDTLRLRMEALDHLDPDEQANVLAMIEGALLRHQVRQIGVTQPTAS